MAPRGVNDAIGSEAAPPRFVDVLPSRAARDCLTAWREARRCSALPTLWDFAPHCLPAVVLPWLLIHRQRSDGELVYGLAGEELIRWFGENPKGKPVLGNVDAPEREQRRDLVRQSMATGMPFWFSGMLLLESHEHTKIGRLCLPARDSDEHVLLVVYFILGAVRAQQQPRMIGHDMFETTDIIWCRASDLAA